MRVKSFLLERDRFYPSNRFLSYWKLFATIRETFWSEPWLRKDGNFEHDGSLFSAESQLFIVPLQKRALLRREEGIINILLNHFY